MMDRCSFVANFYPRPPRGGRLVEVTDATTTGKFLSTPSARRATGHGGPQGVRRRISIHALREEGDVALAIPMFVPAIFLSTPSARRATSTILNMIREVRGFLSTPSARRATVPIALLKLLDTISIHALREEGDPAGRVTSTGTRYFYPRPPRGGRPFVSESWLSAHGAISIHALREEGDYVAGYVTKKLYDFYPRPPRGGRRADCASAKTGQHISIHALREEGDAEQEENQPKKSSFLSPPSARRATPLPFR